jgi:hypothetical protein
MMEKEEKIGLRTGRDARWRWRFLGAWRVLVVKGHGQGLSRKVLRFLLVLITIVKESRSLLLSDLHICDEEVLVHHRLNVLQVTGGFLTVYYTSKFGDITQEYPMLSCSRPAIWPSPFKV